MREDRGRVHGRWRGLAGLRDDTPSHISATRRHCVEGAGGTGGHGRASRRGAERSEALASRAAGSSGARNTSGATSINTQRGRLAGGPPPTGTHSGRALRRPEHQRRPAHQRHNTPRRHNKAARPHRGRAAQPVSEAHRRTTTMSGSPRPLSWRTLEIPSLAATSFAVPSMRGSS